MADQYLVLGDLITRLEREVRKGQRVTVTELAARLHAATTTVYSLEQIRGRDMKIATIEAWAAGLGLRARIVLEPIDDPQGGA